MTTEGWCQEEADRGRHVIDGPLPCCDEALLLRESDEINSLQTRIGQHGYLSNLVWNIRNRYYAHSTGAFTAEEVRWLVEGFLTELRTVRAAGTAPEQEKQP